MAETGEWVVGCKVLYELAGLLPKHYISTSVSFPKPPRALGANCCPLAQVLWSLRAERGVWGAGFPKQQREEENVTEDGNISCVPGLAELTL